MTEAVLRRFIKIAAIAMSASSNNQTTSATTTGAVPIMVSSRVSSDNDDAEERVSDGDMDLPRIREGGLDVQFWSIYLGRREEPGAAIREALERIDAVHEMAGRYSDDVVVAYSVADVRAA